MTHPNEQLVRDYLRGFNEGHLDRVAEFIADDIAIHFPGRNPMSGERRGKEDVLSFYRGMIQRAGLVSEPADVHDVLANHEHVVALITRKVAGIDASVAVVYHVSGGKITEVWWHERDQYVVDEAVEAALQGR